jgi:hypothetical protein
MDFIHDLIHRTWIQSIHKLCFPLGIINGHISTNAFREKWLRRQGGAPVNRQESTPINTLKIYRQASTPRNSFETSVRIALGAYQWSSSIKRNLQIEANLV